MDRRPSTPPASARKRASVAPLGSPPTPEATRRLEENRLRAKFDRDQREDQLRDTGKLPILPKTSTGLIATADIQLTGSDTAAARRAQKRSYETMTAQTAKNAHSAQPVATPVSGQTPPPSVPTSNRDARNVPAEAPRPVKKFAQFVDYNMSTMTDTKGGFLTAEDDPSGGMMPGARLRPGQDERPKHMTEKEWERMQVLEKLRKNRAGPFQPGLSLLTDEGRRKKCRECGTMDIDWVWEEVFKLCVCGKCKEKFPEKYSLLTKTECKEDYLLTDSELRDPDLLPHLSRPNPHKAHWHDMMLFLRCQVEDYALSDSKWGSANALDTEFVRREAEKKDRKEAKFTKRLADLKRRTRAEKFRREADAGNNVARNFGDNVGAGGRHVHEWGRALEGDDGVSVKTCVACGMEVEELEL